jgi:hypothetical protein
VVSEEQRGRRDLPCSLFFVEREMEKERRKEGMRGLKRKRRRRKGVRRKKNVRERKGGNLGRLPLFYSARL